MISSRGGCQMQYCLLGRRSWASSSTLARLGSYVGPILQQESCDAMTAFFSRRVRHTAVAGVMRWRV